MKSDSSASVGMALREDSGSSRRLQLFMFGNECQELSLGATATLVMWQKVEPYGGERESLQSQQLRGRRFR